MQKIKSVPSQKARVEFLVKDRKGKTISVGKELEFTSRENLYLQVNEFLFEGDSLEIPYPCNDTCTIILENGMKVDWSDSVHDFYCNGLSLQEAASVQFPMLVSEEGGKK